MKLTEFDYKYPEELVAQRPPVRRDEARMMVLSREKKTFKHLSIKDLPDLTKPEDLIIVNNTKVLPVRLIGEKTSGGHLEVLLLKEIDAGENRWRAIATRKKRLKEQTTIVFSETLSGEVVKNFDEGIEIILSAKDMKVHEAIKDIGLPPLPPYIKREKREDYTDQDRSRYQTIYAKHAGSAAAPTAGFHLTEKLIEKCRAEGSKILPVTLHVGLDTFTPVRTAEIEDHKMHGEDFFIERAVAKEILKAKREQRRIIAVGTTTVRTLESADLDKWDGSGDIHGHTSKFIYPGYQFEVVDAMLTNFHQPGSSLLMLISAFAGREFVLQMYDEAISKRYSLFSYGDCMLIL